MSDSLQELQSQALADIAASTDARALDALRVDLLGKKGRVTDLLKSLGAMAPDERKAFGERVNRVRDAVNQALEARGTTLANAELARKLASETIDVTLPGLPLPTGGLPLPTARCRPLLTSHALVPVPITLAAPAASAAAAAGTS